MNYFTVLPSVNRRVSKPIPIFCNRRLNSQTLFVHGTESLSSETHGNVHVLFRIKATHPFELQLNAHTGIRSTKIFYHQHVLEFRTGFPLAQISPLTPLQLMDVIGNETKPSKKLFQVTYTSYSDAARDKLFKHIVHVPFQDNYLVICGGVCGLKFEKEEEVEKEEET